MRDFNRIKKLLNIVEEIWEQNPDQRFNQMIINLQKEFYKTTGKGILKQCYHTDNPHNILEYDGNYVDLFHIEDDDFIKWLELKR